LPTVEIRSADGSKIEEAVAAYTSDLRRRHADKPVRQRLPDYLPDRGFPVGLDLFPYTEAELAQLAELSPGWYAAIASGRQI